MKNKEVRKLRREICKNFRMMNNNLRDDYLWRGRFEVRMKDFQYRKYFDKEREINLILGLIIAAIKFGSARGLSTIKLARLKNHGEIILIGLVAGVRL